MRDGDQILSIDNAKLGYTSAGRENVLLEGIKLMVKKGELVALIGKNGSGKTTFLKTLINLHSLISGKIILQNRDIKDYLPDELARLSGFVSTFITENSEMTVEELVRIGRYPYTNIFGFLNPDDRKKINRSLDICGINHLRKRKLHHISDGEKQRAMLARVFAQDTNIILLDEPTSFLDIPNKFEIFSLLKELTEKGKSVIFTTHDLSLATQYADKIWLINHKNITEGAPEDLFLGTEMKENFSSEKLKLNSETGHFGPEIKINRFVDLKAGPDCKLAELWTKKAFERKGIGIRKIENEKIPREIEVIISKEKDKFVWNLKSNDQNIIITSIYQLINHLENF